MSNKIVPDSAPSSNSLPTSEPTPSQSQSQQDIKGQPTSEVDPENQSNLEANLPEEPPLPPPENIWEAIDRNDVASVKSFLKAKVDLEEEDDEGLTPFLYALLHGKKEAGNIIFKATKPAPNIHHRDHYGRDAMMLSIQGGVEFFVMPLFKLKFPINQTDIHKRTALHYAAVRGSKKTCDLLLKARSPVNAQDEDGNTPLHYAMVHQVKGLLQLFSNYNPPYNLQNNSGQSIAHLAVYYKSTEMIKFLGNKKLNVNWNLSDESGMTPALIAAELGLDKILELLLKYGANSSAKTTNGDTLVHVASRNGHSGIIRVCSQLNAPINEANEAGQMPLHLACSGGGSLEIISALQRACADLNAPDGNGDTPLHYAVLSGQQDIAEFLLDNGAEISSKGAHGKTPLHLATEHEMIDMVQFLCDKAADVSAKDENGETPLHYAAKLLNVPLIEVLLKAGAGPNAQTKDGDTPLHLLAHPSLPIMPTDHITYEEPEEPQKEPRTGMRQPEVIDIEKIPEVQRMRKWEELQHNVQSEISEEERLDHVKRACEIAKLLFAGGANVNASNKAREEPLHLSCSSGDVELVSLFIEQQSDLDAKDAEGNAPIHRATITAHIGVLERLHDAGADMNTQDALGQGALEIACKTQQERFVATLISFGADVSTQDRDGKTPLHIACDLCNANMVSMLIQANAPLNIIDAQKNTPLHLASSHMNKKVVEMMLRAGADVKKINSKGLTPMQGVRLTFSKFMKEIVEEREANELDVKKDEYVAGKVFSQNDTPLNTEIELRDSICLMCKRRQAVAAVMPCGHLCLCEVCLKERVNNMKTCPYCKAPATGAVNILFETKF